MDDYTKDTGDRLLEHYAGVVSRKEGQPMELARSVVDCSPAFQGLLGRNGNWLQALSLAGVATKEEVRKLNRLKPGELTWPTA